MITVDKINQSQKKAGSYLPAFFLYCMFKEVLLISCRLLLQILHR